MSYIDQGRRYTYGVKSTLAAVAAIVNPSTGQSIYLRTALGYGQGHPAYDAAREWLKNNVKGIPLLRDPEVAILRKRTKTPKGYNKYGHFE